MSDLTEDQKELIILLRETIGSGMMECKKTLIKFDWDFDKAKEYMQKTDFSMFYLDTNKNW